MKRAILYSLVAIVALLFMRKPLGANPVELGDVAWGRDYETSLAAAKTSGKPIMMLFQEVPG